MVAIDLGGSILRAAQFTVGKGTPTVGKVAYAPLPTGAVQGGEVKDVEAVTAALKELWAREKFSTKQVVFGLANSNVLVRQLDLDWMAEEDFAKSLKYQAADYISFPIEETNLDYHTLNEFPVQDTDGSQRRMKQVLLVAASKETVNQLVPASPGAGVPPATPELVPFALFRAARPGAATADTAEAVIDLGMDMTNVIIHQGGQPRFVRIVAGQAGRHLTKTLADQFGWSLEDAERTKVQLGLTAVAGPDGQPHPAQHVINHVVSALISEIRTSVDFFLQSTPGISVINRVVLTGGGANIKGLAQRLASELRVPVEPGTPLQSVSTGKGAATPEGITESQLSVAVGLALGVA